MSENLNEVLKNILYLIVTGVIPLLITYVIKLLKVKIKSLNDNTKNKTIQSYIDNVIDVIESAVLYTTQTYVDSVKASGKFDEEAHKIAFQIAKEKALSLITEDAKEAITIVYGDFNEYLSVKIEELVKVNK